MCEWEEKLLWRSCRRKYSLRNQKKKWSLSPLPHILSLASSIILRFLDRVDEHNWKRNRTYQALQEKKQAGLAVWNLPTLLWVGREPTVQGAQNVLSFFPRSACLPLTAYSSVNPVFSSTSNGSTWSTEHRIRCYKYFSRLLSLCACEGEQTSIHGEIQ